MEVKPEVKSDAKGGAIQTTNWPTFFFICPKCGFSVTKSNTGDVARARAAHMRKHNKKEVQ